jgi:preprotein translocase subunit SecB
MSVTKADLPVFELTEAFFTSVEFRRTPEVPDPLNVRFNVRVRVHDEKLPEALQIDLKLETPEEQPLMMALEIVGLFEGRDGQPEPDRGELSRFVNERALFMLWPYAAQMTRLTTAQMGMDPVKLPNPLEFHFSPEETAPKHLPGDQQDD